jgi:hypothetical protein
LRIAILAAALLLAACSAPPFVPDPNAPPPAPLPTELAVREYMGCVYAYAIPRWNYDATADELADAAIGACLTELQDVRTAYAQVFGIRNAENSAATVQQHVRQRVFTAIIEARNTHTPPVQPSSSAGT